MKKKILAFMVFLGLALTSVLFISPLKSNAAEDALELAATPSVQSTQDLYGIKNSDGKKVDVIDASEMIFDPSEAWYTLGEVLSHEPYDSLELFQFDVQYHFPMSGLVLMTWNTPLDLNLSAFGMTSLSDEYNIEIGKDISIDVDSFLNTKVPSIIRNFKSSYKLFYVDFVVDVCELVYREEFKNYIAAGNEAVLLNYTIFHDGTAPSVDLPANYIVNVDSMQTVDQILSHIIVIDDNDPNPQIIVRSTTYDPTNRKTGTYQFVVYAQDSFGNSTQDYTFNVIVADATPPANTSFGTITQPNNEQLSNDEIISKFIVSDNYSETVSKVLIKNDYVSSWSKVGIYEIICRATDEAGNYTDTSSYIKVVDKTNPTLTCIAKKQGNNTKLTRENLLSLFIASDDTSATSNITKSILTDGYTANWNTPGTYEVTCRATDEAGNYTDATTTIIVEDTTIPTMVGKSIDAQYNSKIEDLKTLFTYSDDITSLENIIFEIVGDDYTLNYNLKGNYTITARVTDEAGNSSEATAVVRVIDSINPIITVPTEITVGNSTMVSMSALEAKIVAEDDYDGPINFTISDLNDYTTNYQKTGSYRFLVTAIDAAGNKQVAYFTLLVTDTTSPNLFYDKYFICLSQGEVLTNEMILAYASKALGIDVASILSIDGTYDTEVVGAYSISLYLLDGSVQPFTISVGEQKEPAVWTAKGFFSTNMDNWTQFDAWPAWSICAWFSWIAIGIGAALVTYVAILSTKKIIRRAKS